MTLPAELVRLFVRADWMDRAACRGMDPNWWHPAKAGANRDTPKAKAICAECPVSDECLKYAMDNEQRGIWGGISIGEARRGPARIAERARLRKATRDNPVPHPRPLGEIVHGTHRGYIAERRRGIPPCQPCTDARNEHRRTLRSDGRAA